MLRVAYAGVFSWNRRRRNAFIGIMVILRLGCICCCFHCFELLEIEWSFLLTAKRFIKLRTTEIFPLFYFKLYPLKLSVRKRESSNLNSVGGLLHSLCLINSPKKSKILQNIHNGIKIKRGKAKNQTEIKNYN